MDLPGIVVITGTDTEIGKTIATAAVAVLLQRQGASVCVYKPTQTGLLASEMGDADLVATLSGCSAAPDGVRLRDPLSPVMAARREGVTLPSIAAHCDTIAQLSERFDHVLVEGAGGLTVGMGPEDVTIADLISALPTAGVLLVARAALGTLNHTLLTTTVLAQQDALLSGRVRGLIIGQMPAADASAWELEVAEENTAELERLTSWPVLGRLPYGAGTLVPAEFQDLAATWFTAREGAL